MLGFAILLLYNTVAAVDPRGGGEEGDRPPPLDWAKKIHSAT